jgi:transcriptional regulator with XRE-family HTH domain
VNEQVKGGVRLRNRRREKGLSQRLLAEMIGCTPSALCMFEKGRYDALSVERLRKACEVLALPDGALLERASTCYCPNVDCPTHHPFLVGDEIRLAPEAVEVVAGGRFCRWCGEVLEECCSNCGAAFEEQGGFCGSCGVAYLDASLRTKVDHRVAVRFAQMQEQRKAFSQLTDSFGCSGQGVGEGVGL